VYASKTLHGGSSACSNAATVPATVAGECASAVSPISGPRTTGGPVRCAVLEGKTRTSSYSPSEGPLHCNVFPVSQSLRHNTAAHTRRAVTAAEDEHRETGTRVTYGMYPLSVDVLALCSVCLELRERVCCLLKGIAEGTTPSTRKPLGSIEQLRPLKKKGEFEFPW